MDVNQKRTGEVRSITWSSSTDSEPVQLLPNENYAVYIPSALGAATSLKVLVEVSSGTYVVLADAGTDVSVTVAVDKVNLLPSTVRAAGKVKLQANVSLNGKGTLIAS